MSAAERVEPPALPDLVDMGLRLLDRQVVDVHGRPVCNVDDLELTEVDGRLVVSGILVGPGALGPRVGGFVGRFMVAVHQRLRGLPEPDPPRIPIELVGSVGSDVRLVVPAAELHVTPLEDWVRERIVDPIPGSGDA